MIRVRFAPSPTGALHIGGGRTALFNWLFARHNNGKFILRIEDTDRTRSTKEAVQTILHGLEWLGIDWDEGPNSDGNFGPYFQTERMEIYKKYADQLIKEGKAYYCFCTPEMLEEKRKLAAQKKEAPKYDGACRELSKNPGGPFVIRFKMPIGEITEVEDLVRGKVKFENDLLDDFVVVKSDGVPTYNFAAVVDDHLMEISHVIRGDDHLSNTPRQIVLYKAFGWKLPAFAHIPMILGPDKARLSKRHGAASVIEYRDLGYLPEAVINYIAKLGWGYKDQEVFSRQELIDLFTLEAVSKNAAIFDIEKLKWLNGNYIRTALPERIVDLCEPLLFDAYGKQDLAYISKIVRLFLDRLKVINEITDLTPYYFNDDFPFDEKAKKYLGSEDSSKIINTLKDKLVGVAPFIKDNIEKMFKQLAEEMKVKLGVIIHPCRAAVSGRVETPPMYDVLEVLGKDRVNKRLSKYPQ
ncbi:MAG: gltX [Candidatus Saganbacteria bacterium]|uniref:Glutamate--tRNA ligase n=1 Tax=Candidatus Saganbacteria bacterium TaxID=2575572 RepID=A0A833L049_UNCSA|nr:MAG: gltX [Candidatus Saganbacteria bacterium]